MEMENQKKNGGQNNGDNDEIKPRQLEMEKRKEEEYEMQVYGFHIRTVYETLERIIRENIENSCKKLGQSLGEKFNTNVNADANGVTKTTAELNSENLAKLYNFKAESEVKIVRECIGKIMAIPKNVLASHDRSQENHCSPEEFRKLEEEREHLKLIAKRAAVLQARLEEELEIADSIEDQQGLVEGLCRSIENAAIHPSVDGNVKKNVEKLKELI